MWTLLTKLRLVLYCTVNFTRGTNPQMPLSDIVNMWIVALLKFPKPIKKRKDFVIKLLVFPPYFRTFEINMMQSRCLLILQIVMLVLLLTLLGIGLYLASMGVIASFCFPPLGFLGISITFMVLSAMVLVVFLTIFTMEIRTFKNN